MAFMMRPFMLKRILGKANAIPRPVAIQPKRVVCVPNKSADVTGAPKTLDVLAAVNAHKCNEAPMVITDKAIVTAMMNHLLVSTFQIALKSFLKNSPSGSIEFTGSL